MKKLLFILSIFITSISYGQSTPDTVFIKIKSGGGGKTDLSNYFTKGQIDSINAGYYTKSQVDSIVATINATVHINGGSGITVTGTGTTGDPFIISADTTTVHIIQQGIGYPMVRGSGDTIYSKNIEAGTNVTLDSSDGGVKINVAAGASGISKLGTPAYLLTKINDSTYNVDSAGVSALYPRRKDSTVAFTTPYQSSLKANLSGVIQNSGTISTYSGGRPVLSSVNYYISPTVKPTTYTDFHGLDFSTLTGSNNLGSYGDIYQQENTIRFYNDTMRLAVPFFSHVQHNSSGVIGSVWGIRIQTQNASTGSIGEVYNIMSQTPQGKVNNFWSLYVDSANSGIYSNTALFLGRASGGSTYNIGVDSRSDSNYFKGITVGTVLNVPVGSNDVTITPAIKLSVLNNFGAVDNSTSKYYGGVTLGSASPTATSLFVNTPSVSTGFSSGLGIDGTYASSTANVRLTAFGPKSGGLYGQFTFRGTASGTVYDVMSVGTNGVVVGINSVVPTTGSVFTVNSTTNGSLFNRMTSTQFSSIASKPEGLLAYDLTNHKPTWYDGTNIKLPRWTTDSLNYSFLNGTPPIWNQSTTGNAASSTVLATARTIGLTGDISFTPMSFDGSANVTASATVNKINGTLLSGLNTGLLKNTTGTGVPVIATRGTDYLSPLDSLNAVMLSGTIPTKNIPVQNLYAIKGVKGDTTTNVGAITLRIDSAYLDSTIRAIAIAKTGYPIIGSDTLAKLSQVRTMIAAIPSGGSGITVGNEYANQAAAVADGKTNGYVYKLPPDVNGNHVLAVLDTAISADLLGFTVVNTASSKVTLKQFGNYSPGGAFTLDLDWGDGSPHYTFSGTNVFTAASHVYGIGTFNATITKTGTIYNFVIQDSSYASQNVTAITHLDSLPSLKLFTMYQTKVTSFPTNIASTVTSITFSGNNIATFNPPTLPTNLASLVLASCGLTSFSPTVGLPSTITNLDLTNNNLNSTQVDATLNWLNGLTFAAGAKVLLIKQSPAAAPTGASATAITNLTSNGWTITHD